MSKNLAEPTELVNESMIVNGHALGLGKGTEYFNTYFETIWKTNFNLTPRTKANVESYIGEKIWCKNKRKMTSDHSELIVARELLRDYLDQLNNLQFTSERTLVIGATATDLSRFKSNQAIDFLFNNVDDKDQSRNISSLTKMFLKIMIDLELPMNYSTESHDFFSFNMSYEKMLDLAKKIKKGNGLERVYNKLPNNTYNTLLFNDSLYDISESDFLDYFYHTGAHEAYAIMFLPNSFIDPTTPPSKFYNIYYSNIFSDHAELVKLHLGPIVGLISPLINPDMLEDFLVKTISTLLRLSKDMFLNWITGLTTLEHPFLRLFGMALDFEKYNVLFTPALLKIKEYFLNHFETVYVTWKNGFQNGYYHNLNSWKKWAKTGRFYGKNREGKTICIDREIITRLGEMYLLRFEVTEGKSIMVHELQVEDRFKGIEIIDFLNSWNPKTKNFNEQLIYKKVHRSEFYEALQWALGEDINSLDLDIVIVAINRLKAGLSINSTELVPSWSLNDPEVFNFSMVILLEVYRLKSVYSSLTDNKDFVKQYRSNIERFFLQTIKYGISGLTLGLPYAVMNLYYWMVESNLIIPIVNYPEESKPTLELPAKIIKYTKKTTTTTTPSSQSTTNTDFSKYYQNLNIKNPKLNFVFKKKNLKEAMKCEFCALSIEGRFGKQKLRCKQHNSNSQTLSIKPDQMGEYRIRLNDAEKFHQEAGATDVVTAINKAKNFIKAFLDTGVHIDVVIHNIEGGPGTGKSTVARELADIREKQGFNVAILSPFGELLTDYTSVTLLDGEKRDDFVFKTMYKSFELKNTQVVFVEEKGAYDYRDLITFAAMNNTKEIFLVGDKKQTVLQATEGISICSDNCPINRNLITNHELVYNFRNNPFSVKMLNKTFGYEMISFRTDYIIPKFMTVPEYKEEKKDHEKEIANNINIKPIEEISFSDKSIQIFGATPDDKHTIRSKQGKSFDRVAIAVRDSDTNFYDIHGMLVVAISRSRNDTIFVTPENINDNTIAILKTRYNISNPEDIEDLIQTPWPIFEDSKQGPKYTVESLQAQQIILNELENLYEEEKHTLEDKEDIMNKVFDYKGFLTLDPVSFSKMEHCFYDAMQNENNVLCLEKKNLLEFEYQKLLIEKYDQVQVNELPKAAITIKEGISILNHAEIPAICIIIRSGIKKIVLTKAARIGLDNSPLNKQPLSIFTIRNNHVNYITDEPINLQNQIKDFIKSEYTIYYTGDCYENRKFFSTLGKSIEKRKEFVINLATRSQDLEDTEVRFFERIDFQVDLSDKFTHYETLITNNIEKTITAFLHYFDTKELDKKVGGNNYVGKIEVLDSKLVKNKNFIIPEETNQRFDSSIMPLTIPTTITTEKSFLPDTQKFIPIKSRPIKFGKDGYRFGSQLDPTFVFQARKKYNNINVYSGVSGLNKDFKIGSRLIKTGFLFDRTKAGKIKIFKKQVKYSFTPGYGNVFNGDAVETLIAGQRYLTKKKNIPFSFEGLEFARKITREFFRKNFSNKKMIDRYQTNSVLKKAFQDMKQRNYYKRGEAELKKSIGRKMTISFHNKKTFKPIKNGKLNLFKGGQGIAQTPAWFNFIHCPTMRFINKSFHDKLISTSFYDNLVPLRKFRQDLTRAINQLPCSARTAITDAEAFDSNQNWFTIEVEKETRRLQGVSEKYLDSYYKCREPGVFRCYGKFSGKTNGEKGSGFLDTLLGNTNVSMVLSDKVVTGLGPSIVVGKGDDFGKIQCGLQYNEDFQKEILHFSNMKFNVSISDGGEFCGDTFGRAGCFPSITRMCIKALETKTTKYKGGFTENQISFRDKLTDLGECGINNVISANAIAENRDPSHIKSALSTFISLCHINEEQWTNSVTGFVPTRYQLPGAGGLRLPL